MMLLTEVFRQQRERDRVTYVTICMHPEKMKGETILYGSLLLNGRRVESG